MKVTKLEKGIGVVFDAIDLAIGCAFGLGIGGAVGYFRGKSKGLEKAVEIIDAATTSVEQDDTIDVKWPFTGYSGSGITANKTFVKPAVDYITIDED